MSLNQEEWNRINAHGRYWRALPSGYTSQSFKDEVSAAQNTLPCYSYSNGVYVHSELAPLFDRTEWGAAARSELGLEISQEAVDALAGSSFNDWAWTNKYVGCPEPGSGPSPAPAPAPAPEEPSGGDGGDGGDGSISVMAATFWDRYTSAYGSMVQEAASSLGSSKEWYAWFPFYGSFLYSSNGPSSESTCDDRAPVTMSDADGYQHVSAPSGSHSAVLDTLSDSSVNCKVLAVVDCWPLGTDGFLRFPNAIKGYMKYVHDHYPGRVAGFALYNCPTRAVGPTSTAGGWATSSSTGKYKYISVPSVTESVLYDYVNGSDYLQDLLSYARSLSSSYVLAGCPPPLLNWEEQSTADQFDIVVTMNTLARVSHTAADLPSWVSSYSGSTRLALLGLNTSGSLPSDVQDFVQFARDTGHHFVWATDHESVEVSLFGSEEQDLMQAVGSSTGGGGGSGSGSGGGYTDPTPTPTPDPEPTPTPTPDPPSSSDPGTAKEDIYMLPAMYTVKTQVVIDDLADTHDDLVSAGGTTDRAKALAWIQSAPWNLSDSTIGLSGYSHVLAYSYAYPDVHVYPVRSSGKSGHLWGGSDSNADYDKDTNDLLFYQNSLHLLPNANGRYGTPSGEGSEFDKMQFEAGDPYWDQMVVHPTTSTREVFEGMGPGWSDRPVNARTGIPTVRPLIYIHTRYDHYRQPRLILRDRRVVKAQMIILARFMSAGPGGPSIAGFFFDEVPSHWMYTDRSEQGSEGDIVVTRNSSGTKQWDWETKPYADDPGTGLMYEVQEVQQGDHGYDDENDNMPRKMRLTDVLEYYRDLTDYAKNLDQKYHSDHGEWYVCGNCGVPGHPDIINIFDSTMVFEGAPDLNPDGTRSGSHPFTDTGERNKADYGKSSSRPEGWAGFYKQISPEKLTFIIKMTTDEAGSSSYWKDMMRYYTDNDGTEKDHAGYYFANNPPGTGMSGVYLMERMLYKHFPYNNWGKMLKEADTINREKRPIQ